VVALEDLEAVVLQEHQVRRIIVVTCAITDSIILFVGTPGQPGTPGKTDIITILI
jgi:hypothetical protein